jgi:hypothetical protein
VIYFDKIDKGKGTGFEAFTVVMFQVEVFGVVMPCSVVVGYPTTTLHPQDLDVRER